MNARPLAILSVLLAVIAAAWWVLQPGTDGGDQRDRREAHDLEEGPSRSMIEAEAPVEEPAIESPAKDRAEIMRGHQVLVLDEQGEPVPDLVVSVYETDHLSDGLRAHPPSQAVYYRATSSDVRTNGDGVATVASDQMCIVSAVTEGFEGHVRCPKFEAEGDAQQFTLQLFATPMVELVVLDADGEAVREGVGYEAYVGSQAKLALQDPTLRIRDRGSAWLSQSSAVWTLEDGRHFLSLKPGLAAATRLQPEDAPYRYRVKALFGHVAIEPREFNEGELTRLVFQLPAMGSLLLHLHGFPGEVHPGIRLAESDERVIRVQKVKEVLVEGAISWRFDRVPVNEEWAVSYRNLLGEGSQARLTRSQLPHDLLAGPVTSGEVVEHHLHFQWPAGFRGRFVLDEEAADLTWYDFVEAGSRGRARARLYFEGGPRKWDWATIGIFPNGEFFVPLDMERQDHRNLAGIKGIGVTYVGNRSSRRSELGAARVWAFPEAEIASADAVVDLGDVKLEFEEPMLKVRVTNDRGEAIDGAEVSLQMATDWHLEGWDRERFHPANASLEETDQAGESWMLLPDLDQLLRVWQLADDQPIAGETIHTLKVRVEDEDYAPAEVSFAPGVAEVEVQLHRAASIHGSLAENHDLKHVHVVLLPVGRPLTVEGTAQALQNQWAYPDRRQADRAFSFLGVDPGLYDVVFALRGKTSGELLRIPQVEVLEGRECHDPRLDGVSLVGTLDYLRLQLVDEHGVAWKRSDFDDAPLTLWVVDDHGMSGHSCPWEGNEIVFPMPTQEIQDLYLEGVGWTLVNLPEARPGSVTAEIRRPSEGQIRISNFHLLPPGCVVELNVSRYSVGEYQRVLEEAEGGPSFSVRWPRADSYGYSIQVRKDDIGWSRSASELIEIDEAATAAGAVTEIMIPQELLDEIPQ